MATDVRPFVIRGGTIFDGGGGDPFPADVRVDGTGVVREIAAHLTPSEGEEVIDAAGRAVSPGFVDMHSHSDLYTFVREGEGAPLGDAPKLLQGCTAQVFGQDGISAAPVGDHDVDDFATYISSLDGFLEPARWSWRSFGDYLGDLRRHSSTRVAGLIGHSTLRRFVMGMENRPPREDELDSMRDVLDQSMRAGAVGLSTGLVYVPAAYAGTEEMVALCEVVARHGGRFFVHVRSESDRVIEATAEVLEVARRSGVHLHYSHIKTAGRANWHRAGRILEMIDEYRRQGVVVTSDVHPYTAGSTTANVLLPPWVLEGGVDEAIRRLHDPAVRQRAREQLLHDTTSWDNWWAFSDGWTGLRIAGAEVPDIVGQSFSDVIADAGIADPHSQAAFDLIFDLLAAQRLKVSLISFNNVESNVARFMGQPFCCIGSDALINHGGHPHPRLYGTFPRVLGRYVRELNALSLPDAVRAMTSRAADAIGRPDLGRLEVGARADLALFDPATVIDRATYEEPRLPPVGVPRVWVGGRPVVVDGRLAGQVPPARQL